MKKIKKILRYVVTLSQDSIGWIIVLLFHLFWGRRLFWYKGCLFTVLKENSWPRNKNKFLGGWYSEWNGTTLTSHAIILSETGMNLRTVKHELQHSRQMVVRGFSMLLPSIMLLIFWSWWSALLLWAASSLIISSAAFFESWTNNTDPYKDNINEQHATAMSNLSPYTSMDDILDGRTPQQ